MTARQARKSAIATWLLEVSALLAVFPVVDQVVRNEGFRWAFLAVAYLVMLCLGGAGLYLTRGSKK